MIHEWARRWNIPHQAMVELAALSLPYGGDSGTSEQATQNEIRLKAAQNGLSMWRNNSGSFQNITGQWIRFGLGNDSKKINKVFKSSDLIGIGPYGKFVACEVKKPGWTLQPGDERGQAQYNFITTVNMLGGIAGFATDVNDYMRMIQ